MRRLFQISFMVLAALIPVRAQCSHTLVSGGIYCEQSVSPAIVSGTAYALSSVANSSGATAVYTGTITGGAGNALTGLYIRVSGFSTSANNGGFICAASSGTTLTLDNSSAVAETPSPGAAGASGPSDSVSPTQVTFSSGYTKGELIFIGTEALTGGGQPWTLPMVSNTNNYTWTFWGNVGSQSLDGNIVQNAVWYTIVPATLGTSDTITASNPSSSYTLEYALVYSGVTTFDGSGSAIGFGGPGMNASTGNFTVSPNDLVVGYVFCKNPVAVSGTKREEDIDTRGMLSDQVPNSTSTAAVWSMDVEGFIAIGLAFSPTAQLPPTISGASFSGGVFN